MLLTNELPFAGLGHCKNRCRADFQRPDTTQNLGIEFQDAENRQYINFLLVQPPQFVAQNFGHLYNWLPPKYGVQTPRIEWTTAKTVLHAYPILAWILPHKCFTHNFFSVMTYANVFDFPFDMHIYLSGCKKPGAKAQYIVLASPNCVHVKLI